MTITSITFTLKSSDGTHHLEGPHGRTLCGETVDQTQPISSHPPSCDPCRDTFTTAREISENHTADEIRFAAAAYMLAAEMVEVVR